MKDKSIVFCIEHLRPDVIDHELTHIFFNKLCLSSIDELKIEQVDEIVAEFVGKYARNIIKTSKLLKKTIDKTLSQE